jgi:small basic protein
VLYKIYSSFGAYLFQDLHALRVISQFAFKVLSASLLIVFRGSKLGINIILASLVCSIVLFDLLANAW